MDSIIGEYTVLLKRLVSSRQHPFDDSLHGTLSTESGVYRVLEKDSDWQSSVYVGKTSNLRRRIYTNHLMGNRRASTLRRKLINSGKCGNEEAIRRYLKSECLVQFVTITDDADRTSFEHFAVSILRPTYND